ncbi:MAG: hypothetical protein IT371_14755 [Deltaproteobacteria bacterium]|nr:hypothetical protein [Deltaproteobacteria bacterium]
MQPADVVLRFLESVGRRGEAEFYLALFRAEAKERFALIAVDAPVMRQASDAVVLDLRLLSALGLRPVVLLGLLEPHQAAAHAERLHRRLHHAGVEAALLPLAGADETHRAVASTIRDGRLPLLAFAPEAAAEERWTRLGELLTRLETRKLILLNRHGGLRPNGSPISLLNLTTELERVAEAPGLTAKEQLLLLESRRLIFERVPHKLLISITSPLSLLTELFTVKGAGTLLRRGAVIQRFDGLAGVDADRLAALLASSFGRPVSPALFERPLSRVYLEQDYRGAALIVDTPLGGYLTKFAVGREAQGEGLGNDLWARLTGDYPALFWRARAENPINAWYTRQCDGLMRLPRWHLFWKGIAVERVQEAIDYALAQPVDVPHGDPEDEHAMDAPSK